MEPVNPFFEKVHEEEKEAVEMKSRPADRVSHVADPALRKAMEKTLKELSEQRPEFLATLIKPYESLEENFFRLMDIIHQMAKVGKADKLAPEGTDQEKLMWECKHLPEISRSSTVSNWRNIAIAVHVFPVELFLSMAKQLDDSPFKETILAQGLFHYNWLQRYEDVFKVLQAMKPGPYKNDIQKWVMDHLPKDKEISFIEINKEKA